MPVTVNFPQRGVDPAVSLASRSISRARSRSSRNVAMGCAVGVRLAAAA